MLAFFRYSLIACLAIACCAASPKSKVTIVKNPPLALPRRLDLKELDPEMREQLKGYDAYTDCRYVLRPKFTYSVEQSVASKGRAQVRITIREIKIDLKLTTQISLPDNAPPELVAHEEGHRRIAEQCYGVAETLAQSLAVKMIGKSYESVEDSDDQGEKHAVLMAEYDLVSGYHDAMSKQAKKIQDIYDELTSHGTDRRLSEDQAIAKAIQRFLKEQK